MLGSVYGDARKHEDFNTTVAIFSSLLNVSFVDIKGPKKLFPDLPFGNMDSDKVEARKSLLESFLKVRYSHGCPCEIENSTQGSSVPTVEHVTSVPPALCIMELGISLKKRPKAPSSLVAIVCGPRDCKQ